MVDIFLLTKAPMASRSQLCLRLMECCRDAKLYLAGDGVYHMLGTSDLPNTVGKIFACKEDIQARGIPTRDDIMMPDDFYGQLAKDMMEGSDRIYVF
jgi:tRNA 2-thiouridine synthesizing protein B